MDMFSAKPASQVEQKSGSEEESDLLAYCGLIRVRGVIVHGYLRIPGDWRSTGLPPRIRSNLVAFAEPAPGYEIGDIMRLRRVGTGYNIEHTEWVDRVPKDVQDEWIEASNGHSAAPQEVAVSAEDQAVAMLRARYFRTCEDERSTWLDRMIQSVTTP